MSAQSSGPSNCGKASHHGVEAVELADVLLPVRKAQHQGTISRPCAAERKTSKRRDCPENGWREAKERNGEGQSDGNRPEPEYD